MQFETQRLNIRPWQPNQDACQAMDIFGDARVMAWVDGEVRDTSIRQVQGRLQSYKGHSVCGRKAVGSWAVEKKDIGRVIGHIMLLLLPDIRVKQTQLKQTQLEQTQLEQPCDLTMTDTAIDKEGLSTDYVEIRWHFRPSSWGFGYASEAAARVVQYAFEELQLPMLLAIAQPENKRSVALMERLGMQHDGLTTRYYGGEHLLMYKLFSPETSKVNSCTSKAEALDH